MGVNIFVLLLKEIFTTMLIQLVDCIFPDAASGVKVVYRAKDFEDQRVRRCVLFCHQPHNFFFLHFTPFFEIRKHMVLGSDKIKSEHIKPMMDDEGLYRSGMCRTCP